MSPEQFSDSAAVDHRADIYSLGIVIYMMISGGNNPIKPAGNGGWSWHTANSDCQTRPIPYFTLRTSASKRIRTAAFNPMTIFCGSGAILSEERFSVPRDEQDARAEFERQLGLPCRWSSLTGQKRPSKTPTDEGAVARISGSYNELNQAYQRLGKWMKLSLPQKRLFSWTNTAPLTGTISAGSWRISVALAKQRTPTGSSANRR